MLNRYSYVRNNPLRYTDPSGHFISGLINTVKSWFAPKTPTSSLSSKTIEKSLPKNTPIATTNGNPGNTSHPSISAAVLTSGGSAFTQLARNVAQGASTERSVLSSLNVPKNTSLLSESVRRIPDILNRGQKTMGEIKSGAYTTYTAQLRDMINYAAQEGYEFNLYIRDGARVSRPLRDAINNLPAGGSIIPYAVSASTVTLDALPIIVNPTLFTPYIYRDREEIRL